MKGLHKKLVAITLILTLCLSCVGCSKGSNGVKKLKDLEFTVVEDADLPDKLAKFIEEKKVNPCKFTYSNEDYLYIVQGYGTQKSGGYSISVNDLYLTENAIYVKTNLIGPGKDEPVTQTITYPFIVIKIEYMDKPVVFEQLLVCVKHIFDMLLRIFFTRFSTVFPFSSNMWYVVTSYSSFFMDMIIIYPFYTIPLCNFTYYANALWSKRIQVVVITAKKVDVFCALFNMLYLATLPFNYLFFDFYY